ncbi:MAG TPA: hypothetical protein DCS93_09115 [Microscillaceae bacterium]|nr:hypothetical protein [Microscillaceae bacterium]
MNSNIHASYLVSAPHIPTVRRSNDEKMEMGLDNRKFKSLSNFENDEVSDSTIFHYHQENKMMRIEYRGGEISNRFLVRKTINDLRNNDRKV